MNIKKSIQKVASQEFNGRTYYQYEGRYFTSHIRKMHRDVWIFHNGEIPKGFHIHHIDGNPSNNDISNLQLLEGRIHLKMEGKKRVKENPQWIKDFQSKGILKAKEWHKSEEGRKWHSEASKKQWENPSIFTNQCIECKKLYESVKSKGVKFCSNKCKSSFRRKSGIDNENRICINCNSIFIINKYIKKQNCSNCK